MRWFALAGLVALAGCGEGTSAPSDRGPRTTPPGGVTAGVRGEMTLVFFEDAPGGAAGSRPMFELTTPDARYLGEGHWVFEKAHVTLYNPGGENAEIEAARGEFHEGAGGRAYLTGGVVLRLGSMVFTLEDLEWVEEDGVLTTERPVRLEDGETRLEASGLRYHALTDLRVLTDVRGVARLKRSEKS